MSSCFFGLIVLAMSATAQARDVYSDPRPGDIPFLIETLKEKDYSIHIAATEALVRIGKPATSALTDTLTDDNDDSLQEFAKVLVEIGPDAKRAIPALAHLVLIADRSVGINSMTAIVKIHPLAVLNTLSESLIIRFHVVSALEEIGAFCSGVVPQLTAASNDESFMIREEEAAAALRRIDPQAAEQAAIANSRAHSRQEEPQKAACWSSGFSLSPHAEACTPTAGGPGCLQPGPTKSARGRASVSPIPDQAQRDAVRISRPNSTASPLRNLLWLSPPRLQATGATHGTFLMNRIFCAPERKKSCELRPPGAIRHCQRSAENHATACQIQSSVTKLSLPISLELRVNCASIALELRGGGAKSRLQKRAGIMQPIVEQGFQ